MRLQKLFKRFAFAKKPQIYGLGVVQELQKLSQFFSFMAVFGFEMW